MHIVYFAKVREVMGSGGEDIDLPGNIVTIADCIGWLCAQGAPYAEAFGDLSKLRFAADQAMADLSAPITGVRELAIFPPVTGG